MHGGKRMSQKEQLINLLTDNETMTQVELSEGVYGDRQHSSAIYASLMSLVEKGTVLRIGSNPSYYKLSGEEIIIPQQQSKSSKEYRDVFGDVITNESIEAAEQDVQNTDNYGPENDLITRCLQKFPLNTDPDLVAMKVGLIDITNSTHLSQHKSMISMVELADIIASIPNIDERIAKGDPDVVKNIHQLQCMMIIQLTKNCFIGRARMLRQTLQQQAQDILIIKGWVPRFFYL